ncbi:hypothetical protein Acr_14g0000410 [Actinidia rufa]|uniref:Pentatricopeptide repeat-containing protein n=1 Tax=Actinidia rufa TaxID=165716 RepID=A0A7J0FNX0_9ERIC|nr:hypothetical protein Acr_14g0000410 [Actinidia rufa]
MHINGVPIDTYTLCSSLTACSDVKTVEFAAVFDDMPMRNTVCANALLSGYAEAKLWVEGLELVRNMPMLKLNYDSFTLSATLIACGGLSAIELGGQDRGREEEGMCCAQRITFAPPLLSLATLSIYRPQSREDELMAELIRASILDHGEPPSATSSQPQQLYLTELHLGLWSNWPSESWIEYFESMVGDFGLDPKPECYSCLIELLRRAGELEKAWKLVNEMFVQSEWKLHCFHVGGSA